MNIETIRDRLALAAAAHRTVKVELRNGEVIEAVPEGGGKPRWFKLGDLLVHQYNIVNIID